MSLRDKYKEAYSKGGEQMICYLVRHGKDDDSIRGGWSSSPLTEQGIVQARELAATLLRAPEMNLAHIFTSDLLRAVQTAEIFAESLNVPVTPLPQFREVNNGVLAGMKNSEALEKYPGLFWNALAWDEHYPGGESPHEFFDRISKAWFDFLSCVQNMDGNVMLVTHGGVIHVILYIVNQMVYSNQNKPIPVKHAELIAIDLNK